MAMLPKVLLLAIGACAVLPTSAGTKTAKLRHHERNPQVHTAVLAQIAARISGRQGGAGKPPQVADIVTSLAEVTKTFQDHQSKMRTLAQTRERDCAKATSENGELKTSKRKGEQIAFRENSNLKVLEIAMKDHKAEEKELTEEISETLSTIDKLTKELKTLRADHLKTNKQAKTGLQELNNIITRVEWQEEQQQRHSSMEPARLKHDVVNLKLLGRQLTSTADSDAPTLFQVSMASDDGEGRSDAVGESRANQRATAGAAGVLQADRQDLLQARRAEVQGFREKEKKLIGLIEAEHKALQNLETQLKQERLVITDKLRQIAGTRRALTAANRVVERAKKSLESTQQLCKVQFTIMKIVVPLRTALISLIQTPMALLRTMDTAMFLAKDLKEFKSGPPSFVQLGAYSNGLQADGESLDSSAISIRSAAGDGMSLVNAVMLQEGMGASMNTRASTDDGASGPFDTVLAMIKSLLQNLREEANADTNLDQWCLESASEAQRNRQKIVEEQNDVNTEIVWAETEIKQMEESIEYLAVETTRREKFLSKLTTEKEAENGNIDKQLTDDHGAAKVLSASVSALKVICNLNAGSGGSAALLQSRKHVKTVSKKTQCEEAVEMLTTASSKLKSLDEAVKTYKESYNEAAGDEMETATDEIDEQKRSLSASKAAKARRAHELTMFEGDKKQKVKDLLLIEESVRQTEKKCSVKETHEERMARRKSEIDALKSALKVLNGEEIPV